MIWFEQFIDMLQSQKDKAFSPPHPKQLDDMNVCEWHLVPKQT